MSQKLMRKLIGRQRSHIAAADGWFVGTPCHADDVVDCVWWEPIIAWLVTTDGFSDDGTLTTVDPVTVNVVGDNERCVLRGPDGVIREPECGTYGSDAEVVDYWRSQDEAAAKRREAKAGK